MGVSAGSLAKYEAGAKPLAEIREQVWQEVADADATKKNQPAMTTKSILVCTVGGSHQPIVTAINDARPDYTLFVCSGKDPGTGRAGSDVQIIGTGLVIKAKHDDPKATLANIPAQTGLSPGAFEVIIVPADDLDGAVASIRKAFAAIGERFPQARIIADYTGGTKTMTAALVTAVLETDSIDLQLVTGNRADLVKVRNGTEYSASANIDAIRLERAMAPFLGAWRRFAYDEAALGLAAIRIPGQDPLRRRLFRARDLSRAFAAWDRFDHDEALRILDIYAAVISHDLGKHLGVLRALVETSEQQEPLRLFDLWHNAERRAAQGRYDDAVARLYRLLEWTAQWLLRSRCGIDTSDIQPDRIPAGLDLKPDRFGKYQAGLYAAWTLIGKLTTGPAKGFVDSHLPALLGHVLTRNNSILAHGYSPIDQEAWSEFQAWTETNFMPMLLEETKSVRLRAMPPQLPDDYRWLD